MSYEDDYEARKREHTLSLRADLQTRQDIHDVLTSTLALAERLDLVTRQGGTFHVGGRP